MRRETLTGISAGPPRGMPLTRVQIGQRVRLAAVEAGCGLQGRLLAMGFFPGIEMEVIQKTHADHGPILIRLGNCRMALGWGMADKMRVE
jgi:ferrous iron transport protein A